MIVGAFAAGDAATLRPLLNDEVFENFKRAIDNRTVANETLQTTLVGINRPTSSRPAEPRGGHRHDRLEQINVTKCRGQVVDGDP
jgi:predicted lipid-binding transport protein (Tim44 family)